jgi:hypothetical protein
LANRNASDRRGSVVVDGSIPLVFFSPRACPGPVKTKLHTKHDDPHSRRRAHRIERHTQCAVEIQDTRRGQGGLLALVACHSLRRMKVKGTGLPDWQRSKRSCRARSKRRELESRGCDDKRESAVISEAVRPPEAGSFSAEGAKQSSRYRNLGSDEPAGIVTKKRGTCCAAQRSTT